MPDEQWPNLELPQPSAPAGDDDDVEPRLSPRERGAERAYRAAVFGLVFVPLLVYAGVLLLRICFARGRLDGRPRRQALTAGAILLALPAVVVAAVVALILFPPDHRPDLRDYPHPPALIGVWAGTIQDPLGETRIEIQLRGDASMRYRETGAAEVDYRGYWAYTERRLFLQTTRVAKGAKDWLARTISWDAHMPNDDELALEHCRLKRVAAR